MPGKWRELMPQARELRLELGCGKGRFTAGTAAAEPDVLFIAVERVPDAMVMAMERCVAQGLTNVYFIDANADQLPLFFAPGEVDRIYINFCDPWPSNRHAKRRLTHGNFLRLYRQVLKMGGQIHFKTDNQDLFTFSIEELPLFGFELSEVTRDLHANGPVGVMTDYEAKFYEPGPAHLPVRGDHGPLGGALPHRHQAGEKPLAGCLCRGRVRGGAGAARAVGGELPVASLLLGPGALPHRRCGPAGAGGGPGEKYLFYNEYPPEGEPLVRPVTAEELAALPTDAGAIPGADWYVVDKDFTWTYVQTHEADCGPYFCPERSLSFGLRLRAQGPVSEERRKPNHPLRDPEGRHWRRCSRISQGGGSSKLWGRAPRERLCSGGQPSARRR